MNLFGERDDLGSVLSVPRSRETVVGLVEFGEGLETDVKSCGSVPFGKVGDEVFGLREGLLEGSLKVSFVSYIMVPSLRIGGSWAS